MGKSLKLKMVKRRKPTVPITVDFDLIDCIKPGSVCILWKGSHMARLVRVERRSDSRNEGVFWYTRPYLEQGYPEKRVHEDELTLIENEMEILAWASSLNA